MLVDCAVWHVGFHVVIVDDCPNLCVLELCAYVVVGVFVDYYVGVLFVDVVECGCGGRLYLCCVGFGHDWCERVVEVEGE